MTASWRFHTGRPYGRSEEVKGIIMAKDRADASAQHPICWLTSASYSASWTNRRMHTKSGRSKGNIS